MKKLKNISLVLLVIVVSCVIGFNIWFNSGFISIDKYENLYFMNGDDEFINNAVSDKFRVGFAKEILTPEDIESTKYYLGGYFTVPATSATEVHDDLYVRAVIIDDNSGRGAVAIAVIDTIGLTNYYVNIIRQRLSEFSRDNNIKSINVLTTHVHSGIDTMGLWGPLPMSGKNGDYLENVISKTVKVIKDAYNNSDNGDMYYGESVAEEMFADHRAPVVMDERIARLRFNPDNTEAKDIMIVNLASHPVTLKHGTSVISADFPAYMGRVIENNNAEFILINGAIGGLVTGAQIPDYQEGMTDIEEMIEYGTILGNMVMSIQSEDEQLISPVVNIRTKEINLPFVNPILRFAGRSGIINNNVVRVKNKPHKLELITEISYMELGNFLKIMFIPGELLPELAIGGLLTSEEAYHGIDYDYPLFEDMVDGRLLIFGLANDEIGYIIPDNDFAVGKTLPYLSAVHGHYEETVSLGPNTASIMNLAMQELIEETR